MSVLARSRVITILGAATLDSAFAPEQRLRCVEDGEGAAESLVLAVMNGAAREFALFAGHARPWTTAYIAAPVWFQEYQVRIGYAYGAGSDREHLMRMMDADARTVIEVLADPNNWNSPTDTIDSIEFDETAPEDIFVGEDEDSSVGLIRPIPFNLIHT